MTLTCSAAEAEPGVKLYFSHKLIDGDLDKPQLTFKWSVISFDHVSYSTKVVNGDKTNCTNSLILSNGK